VDMSLYIKYGHEILQSICGSLIPYLGTFWIMGLQAWRAENRVSIVLCPTNTTHNSVIYKLTGGLVVCFIEHCIFIVP
jgi:hypothetical protein